MNYSIPILLSLIIIIFCVCFLLFANGIIKMPKTETEAPVYSSKIDEILKELESMPVSQLQKLKFEIQQIFKNKNIILPTIP